MSVGLIAIALLLVPAIAPVTSAVAEDQLALRNRAWVLGQLDGAHDRTFDGTELVSVSGALDAQELPLADAIDAMLAPFNDRGIDLGILQQPDFAGSGTFPLVGHTLGIEIAVLAASCDTITDVHVDTGTPLIFSDNVGVVASGVTTQGAGFGIAISIDPAFGVLWGVEIVTYTAQNVVLAGNTLDPACVEFVFFGIPLLTLAVLGVSGLYT